MIHLKFQICFVAHSHGVEDKGTLFETWKSESNGLWKCRFDKNNKFLFEIVSLVLTWVFLCSIYISTFLLSKGAYVCNTLWFPQFQLSLKTLGHFSLAKKHVYRNNLRKETRVNIDSMDGSQKNQEDPTCTGKLWLGGWNGGRAWNTSVFICCYKGKQESKCALVSVERCVPAGALIIRMFVGWMALPLRMWSVIMQWRYWGSEILIQAPRERKKTLEILLTDWWL